MVGRMPSPWKHPDTGVYYLRQGVPARLRDAVGVREIKQSLGTKDLREAKRRFPAASEAAQRRLALAETGASRAAVRLTLQEIAGLSGEWYREALASEEPNPQPEEQYDLMLSSAEEARDRRRVAEFVKPYIDELLEAKGLVIEEASRRQLTERLFWDAVKLWQTLSQRARGDYSVDPHLATLPAWHSPGATGEAGKPTVGPTFADLIEGWALDANPTATVKAKFTRHLSLLAKHRGFDDVASADASRVERKDIIAFREAEQRAGKAPKTVKTELSGIGAVFSWAFNNEKISTNPATKIEVGALKAAKRRGERSVFPYTSQEAVKILSAARQEEDADLRWLSWLCAFSGARISEVAGMRGRDLQEIERRSFIEIGMNGRSAKTASSRRRVPLHNAIIAEGFLEYARTKKGDDKLFSSWAADKVRRWLRGRVGITDKTKSPNHSWRHRFEDEGRAAGIEEDIRDALSGHKNARIGREYGTGYTDPRLLHRLAEAIDKITVPKALETPSR